VENELLELPRQVDKFVDADWLPTTKVMARGERTGEKLFLRHFER